MYIGITSNIDEQVRRADAAEDIELQVNTDMKWVKRIFKKE